MGVAERRKREREARSALILEAAKELFDRKGYRHTTMEDVADSSELGKGTLYSYFPSKEAIYFRLLINSLDALSKDLKELLEGDFDVQETVDGASRAIRTFHRERKGLSEIVLVQDDETWELLPERMVATHEALLLEIIDLLGELLRRTACKCGHDLDKPLEASALFLALEVGLFALTRMAPPAVRKAVDEKALLGLVERMVLEGLLGLERSHPGR